MDLDGTVLDAERRQVAVAAAATREIAGSDLDGHAFWRHKRSGLTTLAALRRLGISEDAARRIDERWRETVEDASWLRLDAPMPGALQALAAMHGGGWRISVVTARTNPVGAAAAIERVGLTNTVDLVVVAPAAAVAEKARFLRSVAPSAHVGDTETDGEAAACACVPFVAVSTGQRDRDYLLARGFDVAESLGAAFAKLLSVSAPHHVRRRCAR